MTIRRFFEENDLAIRHKIQKIFYILEIENGKGVTLNIDSLLLYYNKEGNDNKNTNPSKASESNYIEPLIKFELVLIYYSLFMLYNEMILEKYNLVESKSKGILEQILLALKTIFNIALQIFLFPIHISKTICFKKKFVDKVYRENLFKNIYDINEHYKKKEIKSILTFLGKHISGTEILLNNIIYKIYFPIMQKSYDLKNVN